MMSFDISLSLLQFPWVIDILIVVHPPADDISVMSERLLTLGHMIHSDIQV